MKLILVLMTAMMMTGCATGPSPWAVDENGQVNMHRINTHMYGKEKADEMRRKELENEARLAQRRAEYERAEAQRRAEGEERDRKQKAEFARAEKERDAFLAKMEAERKKEIDARNAEQARLAKLPGVRIGMTANEVLTKTQWGKPSGVHRTTTAAGTREQWVYGIGSYLYFNNGILYAIQN